MTRGRIAGLDGLRAVAVLMVMATHTGWGWTEGGWLGVEVFFVISGYLITSQLVRPDWRLGDFMWRRLARLWPALLVACAFIAVLDLFTGVSILRTTLPGAFYLYTPVMLIPPWSAPDSYAIHTWSLAVEMQFYLLWAIFMLRARHWQRDSLAKACLALAAVSYAGQLAAVLAGRHWEAYFATPFRVDGLLIGAFLAVSTRRLQKPLPVIAALLLAIAVGMPIADPLNGLMIVVFSPLAILLTAGVVDEMVSNNSGRLATVFDHPALRWVGVRSYSLYLWHVPIFSFVRQHPVGGHGAINGPIMLAAWGVATAAACLSYSFVEVPARRWLTSRWTFRRELHRVGSAPSTCARPSS